MGLSLYLLSQSFQALIHLLSHCLHAIKLYFLMTYWQGWRYLLIIDKLFTQDLPFATSLYCLLYYFLSIPERHGPLPQTICSCLVRSELATSWSHEMKTKCPMCGGGEGCSGTAACFSAHQLWSPTGAPRARTAAKNSLEAWGTCGLTCFSRTLPENLTNEEGRTIGTVTPLSERSTSTDLLYTWCRVCVCDCALTFSRINGHIVVLSEKLPVALMPFTFLYNWTVY